MYMFGSGRGRRCGGEFVRELGLGFSNPVRKGGVWDVCLCLGCGGVGSVGRRGVAWTREGGVALCLCVLLVWILC